MEVLGLKWENWEERRLSQGLFCDIFYLWLAAIFCHNYGIQNLYDELYSSSWLWKYLGKSSAQQTYSVCAILRHFWYVDCLSEKLLFTLARKTENQTNLSQCSLFLIRICSFFKLYILGILQWSFIISAIFFLDYKI